MKKIYSYNKKYNIIIKDSKDYSDEEIKLVLKNVIKHLHEKELLDAGIKDVPYEAPEEYVTITHNEKISGGKNPLTMSMLETALKSWDDDEGATFKAYVDEMIKSLEPDRNRW